jgi:putative ABC transport system permease protein
MTWSLLGHALEQGLVFGIMALGVYLTFQVLNFPDLSVDGTFPLGAAIMLRLSSQVGIHGSNFVGNYSRSISRGLTAFFHTGLSLPISSQVY